MDRTVDTSGLVRLLAEQEDVTTLLEQCKNDIHAPTLTALLRTHQQECGLTIAQIADAAMISQPFAYQIFNGIRSPGRNSLICIACAMRLDLGGLQRLLKVSRRGELYPRVRRDAAIIFGIQHGYALLKIDELLHQVGEASVLCRPG